MKVSVSAMIKIRFLIDEQIDKLNNIKISFENEILQKKRNIAQNQITLK